MHESCTVTEVSLGESGTWWNMTFMRRDLFWSGHHEVWGPRPQGVSPIDPTGTAQHAPDGFFPEHPLRHVCIELQQHVFGSSWQMWMMMTMTMTMRRMSRGPFLVCFCCWGRWWLMAVSLRTYWGLRCEDVFPSFSIIFCFCLNCGFAMPCLLFDILVAASPLSWRFVRESSCATETTLITVSDYI